MNFNCKNYCIALQIVKINLYKFYCITIVCNNVAIAIVTMAIALHCIVQIYLISYNFCKLQLKLQFSKSEISYNSAPSELRYKRFLGGSADEGGVKMEHAYGIYGIWIENALIRVFQPKFNREGIIKGFRF